MVKQLIEWIIMIVGPIAFMLALLYGIGLVYEIQSDNDAKDYACKTISLRKSDSKWEYDAEYDLCMRD